MYLVQPWQNPSNPGTKRACEIYHVGYLDVTREQVETGTHDLIMEMMGVSETKRMVYRLLFVDAV